jgi:hypothetical protein
VVTVALTSAPLYAWAFSVPEGRYARSYGGTDQCLAGTGYASSRADITLSQDDILTATPAQTGEDQPELRFKHASKGSLSAADRQTQHVVDEHGC